MGNNELKREKCHKNDRDLAKSVTRMTETLRNPIVITGDATFEVLTAALLDTQVFWDIIRLGYSVIFFRGTPNARV